VNKLAQKTSVWGTYLLGLLIMIHKIIPFFLKRIRRNSRGAPPVKVSITSLLPIIKMGLEAQDAFNDMNKPFRVINIEVVNVDSLQCRFSAYSETSADVKTEISSIMVYLCSLFKGHPFEGIHIKNYLVRAYDQSSTEIMFAISSRAVAEQIMNGNAVEWLKSTYFQENTKDYRLGLAKGMISEIEKSLRVVITDVLKKKFGTRWWNESIGINLSSDVKRIYESQFGVPTEDGDILIEYTFTLQLKKIICTNWVHFRHLFQSKNVFENSMDQLNLLRREEAHNRNIAEQQLDHLNKIYNLLLIKIGQKYPEILPQYLIENWRSKIKSIMMTTARPSFDKAYWEKDETILGKLSYSIMTNKEMIAYLDSVILKLESIITPIQKKFLHDELVDLFRHYRNLHSQLIDIKYIQDGKVEETITEIRNHEEKMKKFSEKFLFSEA
jgi:hypothetical protein